MGLMDFPERHRPIGRPPVFGWRGLVAYTALLALMSAALYLIFIFAPAERVQGDVQRLLYGHVSTAWLAFLSFGIVGISGIIFLWNKDTRWDSLAVAAAEIGVVFTTVTLVTGSIWGRSIWNAWWAWDPRLTTTIVLWFIYVAYLILRTYIDDISVRRRVAAIFGIFGFVDVPIVWFSVQWWRSLHPVQTITQAGGGMPREMLATLLMTLVAFTVFFFIVLRQRYLLERASEEGDDLRAAVHRQLDVSVAAADTSVPEGRT